MSNKIPMPKDGESSTTWPEFPNQFMFTPQPANVYSGQPPQLMWFQSQSQSMAAAGDISTQLQMPSHMVQAPGHSQGISAGNGKRKADESAGGSETKRGCPSYKPCELIDALSVFLPYPPKANAAATLSDVIDYIKITQAEIKQLEEIRSQQLSQLTAAGTQYQTTATQGNIIPLPGSPVDGLIEIPNQVETNDAVQGNNIPLPGSPIHGLIELPGQLMGTNDVVPATSFPVNNYSRLQ